MADSTTVTVVEAEVMSGAVLVHFSDGTSVLYHADFLYSVQHADGNIEVSPEME